MIITNTYQIDHSQQSDAELQQLELFSAQEQAEGRSPDASPPLRWLARYENFLLSQPWNIDASLALDGLIATFDCMGLTYVKGVRS